MRKLKERWNRKGVSPIIASILMVAVTVVLAAVLYVMVSGITTTSSSNVVVGGWQAPDIESKTNVTLKFGSFTEQIAWTDVKIIMENVDTNESWDITFNNNTGEHPSLTVHEGANTSHGLTITATDVAQNQRINQGDSLYLHWNDTDSGRYKLTLLYLQTGDVIDMSGSKILFTI